jgi:flagellar motility protein MotE (MotC chaperone)
MSALNRERERVQNLKNENARIQANIQKDRERIEKIVSQSEELQNQRMRVLGEMFGSMRPEEAAPILLTMSDKMVSNIIRMIPESRSQSKIMGALGVIDVTRAAKISQLIGRSPRT